MSKRSDKFTALGQFCDLETGVLDKKAFADLDLLYEKAKRYHTLCQTIRGCRLCEGLNVGRITECAPGWGYLNATVMIVGQSLHEPGMYSQIPFIGGSGLIVDAALRLSGIGRHECFWTNAVHCHPEKNRASTEEEKENCWLYLAEEVEMVQPKIIVSLGKDAKQAIDVYFEEARISRIKRLNYIHPASLIYSAPEAIPNYVVKMSLDLDKVIEKVKE